MGYFLCVCKKCNNIDDTSNINEGIHQEGKCMKQICSYQEAELALDCWIPKQRTSMKLLPPSLFFNLSDTKPVVIDILKKYKFRKRIIDNYEKRGTIDFLIFHKHFYKCIDYIVTHQCSPHTKRFENAVNFVDEFTY